MEASAGAGSLLLDAGHRQPGEANRESSRGGGGAHTEARVNPMSEERDGRACGEGLGKGGAGGSTQEHTAHTTYQMRPETPPTQPWRGLARRCM